MSSPCSTFEATFCIHILQVYVYEMTLSDVQAKYMQERRRLKHEVDKMDDLGSRFQTHNGNMGRGRDRDPTESLKVQNAPHVEVYLKDQWLQNSSRARYIETSIYVCLCGPADMWLCLRNMDPLSINLYPDYSSGIPWLFQNNVLAGPGILSRMTMLCNWNKKKVQHAQSFDKG